MRRRTAEFVRHCRYGRKTEDLRRTQARGNGRGQRRQERRAGHHSRRAAQQRAVHHRKPSPGQRHRRASGHTGGAGRKSDAGRLVHDHRPARGAQHLRPRGACPPPARVLLFRGRAAGRVRQGRRILSRRLRHRLPPHRSAHQGLRGAGRGGHRRQQHDLRARRERPARRGDLPRHALRGRDHQHHAGRHPRPGQYHHRKRRQGAAHRRPCQLHQRHGRLGQGRGHRHHPHPRRASHARLHLRRHPRPAR